MFKKFYTIFSIIFIVNLILSCSDQVTEPREPAKTKMYVYSNFGKTFYRVDYKTFEVEEEIQLAVADTISCQGMILSTNRDFLFFKAEGPYPNPPFGFAIYNINKDELENTFFTEFKGMGPAYFISAKNYSKPGLIYVHFRDHGTYSIDLFKQRVEELISDEHCFELDKRIFHSPDGKWTVVHKHWSSDIKGSFSELEFYATNSGLHDLQFVLNKDDKDSVSVYDFEFSKDNRLYITFQLSDGRSRGIESYFGSYDLETKQLYHSSLKFPWSLSGYFLGYSVKRNEVYAVSSDGQFYIIDTETYSIKDTVDLSVVGEQSPILITPDDNYAFVGYPDSDSIFVIDLDNRQVTKTISLTRPYNMIIP